MLRKTAAGAGLGAAVVAAPSITGLSVAPIFASAQSCVPVEGTFDVIVTPPAVAGGPITILAVPVTVSMGAAPNCTATVTIPANPDPTAVAADIDITGTLSDGSMFAGQFNSATGGAVVVPVPCNTPVTITSLEGLAFGSPFFPVGFDITRQDPVTAC